jgi:integrase/recombinase XerD
MVDYLMPYQDLKRVTCCGAGCRDRCAPRLKTETAAIAAASAKCRYLEAAGIKEDKKGPLFRTINRFRTLTGTGMNRFDAYQMIKRQACEADLPPTICCHTFRARGITAYLQNNGTLEKAQAIAAHESPQTTKLYDRTADAITLDEVEKIAI